MPQTRKKHPEVFRTPYSKAKLTMEEILERGCEEEITWWIRHILERPSVIVRNRRRNFRNISIVTLMDCCVRFQIRDSKLVVELLNVLVDGRDSVLSTAIYICRNTLHDETEKCRQKGLQTFDYLSYFLHHASQRKESFNGLWFTDRRYEYNTNVPVLIAVREKPTKPLLILLQYGFPIPCREIWVIDCSFLESARKIPQLRMFFKIPNSQNWDDQDVYQNTMHFEKCFSKQSEEDFCHVPYDVRCLFLILSDMYFQTAFQWGGDEVDGFCEKFRIIWRALSYPFITLYKCSGSTCGVYECWEYFHTLHRSDIQTVCAAYLQPRSLKHLCRFTVRRVLHQNWKLPHGIMDLNLPTVICKYLNLEID